MGNPRIGRCRDRQDRVYLSAFFAAEIFGKLEDQTLLGEVAAICLDAEFFSWVGVFAKPMKALENTRLWGRGALAAT